MSAIHFTVPVAAKPDVVRRKLKQAAKDPSQFVHMFTTSADIKADVAEGRADVWRIRVEGPQFRSAGTAAVLTPPPAQGLAAIGSSASTAPGSAAFGPSNPDGTNIEIQIEVKGKGWLSIASPVIALASGKIEDEATDALQREFGVPPA